MRFFGHALQGGRAGSGAGEDVRRLLSPGSGRIAEMARRIDSVAAAAAEEGAPGGGHWRRPSDPAAFMFAASPPAGSGA